MYRTKSPIQRNPDSFLSQAGPRFKVDMYVYTYISMYVAQKGE